MAEEEKQENGAEITQLITQQEEKSGFPLRRFLIYSLLLASGLFLGVLYAYLF